MKVEPLESGKDSVKINLVDQTLNKMAYDINNKRIDHMDWWAFLNMLKTTLQRLVIKLVYLNGNNAAEGEKNYVKYAVTLWIEQWRIDLQRT